MGVGFIMSKRRTLTPEGSKIIATILIWVLYPSLLFTRVVVGIDSNNLPQFGIMSISSVIILVSGLAIGYLILKLTNPPKGFRYGAMLAVAMGNHGDLPIANQFPFLPGDGSRGVAYISAFLCLINLFFFSVGYKLFGEDFREMNTSPMPSMMDISLPSNMQEAGSTVHTTDPNNLSTTSMPQAPGTASKYETPNVSASPSVKAVASLIPSPNVNVTQVAPASNVVAGPAAMALTRAASFKNVPQGLSRRESFSNRIGGKDANDALIAAATAGGSSDNLGGSLDTGLAANTAGGNSALIPLRNRAPSASRNAAGSAGAAIVQVTSASSGDLLGKGSSAILTIDLNEGHGSTTPLNAGADKFHSRERVEKLAKPHISVSGTKRAAGWLHRQTILKSNTISPEPASLSVAGSTKKKAIFSDETWFWIKAFGNLANIATVLGLFVAVIAPLRNLFQYPTANKVGQPEPPFLFLYDTLYFLGDAAVPLGLVNLGAALGRLNLRSMLPIRIILSIAFARLLFFPLVGFTVIEGLVNAGIIGKSDKMLRFVLMIETCVPTASSTVFFTQLWHPRGEADHIASVVLIEYLMASVTMVIGITAALSILTG
ncbi:hypothetical protein HDU96_008271 [Phlyctochytrium bullatum]|nr:hypothetical protein HDU96_008271 [Phlyctochytrium bullatum]